jgi:RNA polymerase sigma-70 factor (ECF subfamily)
LFDFEREFSPQSATRIVASESLKLSAEQRQRDVFETHRHRVFAVSYYMTANEVEAEHILADTFVNAFARQQEPDAAGVDRALLAQLERRFSLAPTEAAVPDADLILVRASTRRIDMEEALRVLPPAERLVFLLKDVEGYNAGKIAGLLDRPEREVLRTLFSARIRMRNALAAVQEARQREKNDPEVNQAQPEEASAPA